MQAEGQNLNYQHASTQISVLEEILELIWSLRPDMLGSGEPWKLLTRSTSSESCLLGSILFMKGVYCH